MLLYICIEQMMMYLEIQPIAFRCKFFMHVSVKDMREKVSSMHNISMYLQTRYVQDVAKNL